MSKKIYCKNCGNELDSNSLFCSECGEKIEKEEKTTKEKVEEKPTKEPEEKDTKEYSVLEEASKRSEAKDNNVKTVIVSSLITFILCMISMLIYTDNFLNVEPKENTPKVSKNVTIVDDGLAEAVDKIYDAVVVVENYVKESLYATGTGFVYKTADDKAYILTNQHVVDGATSVKVVFTNEKSVEATIVGGDVYSDIAVLSVKSSDVVAVAELGSSDTLRVGDTTFAVGAPLDSSIYSWTVTRGILSGKNRLVEVSLSNYFSTDYVMEVLQTDAAINSGNSGGPLCNSNGEVIGVTNMKIASSQVEGMGFAIPIETAIKYADIYVSGGTVERPYLGVSMYDYTSKSDSSLNGIYIQTVEGGSPADLAGLKRGDVITKVDGKTIKNTAYLKYELYKHNVGDTIKISYIRNGKEYIASVVLKKAM